MNRQFRSFSIQNTDITKQQVLGWADQSGTCVFLDNHQYQLPHQQYECIAAVGVRASVSLQRGGALDALQSFLDLHKDWCFGHLGYDLKAETEGVDQDRDHAAGFPDLFFFIPEYVIRLSKDVIEIGSLSDNHAAVMQAIQSVRATVPEHTGVIAIKERVTRAEYVSKVSQIKSHILRGDCYELNYCMEFYAEDVWIQPLPVYHQLTALSPNPFSAYYRAEHLYLLCASPERFLSKRGRQLCAQPIKGTMGRDTEDAVGDERLRDALRASEKDKSENVMVVDLVRNDLSRVCEEGSVRVEELFGVYTFPHLHHMISTISGVVREGTKFSDCIRTNFPMGSMTGAPKKKVLELIDRYESSARGIFSGALGYITPDGDFDFNVVIRSIVYNQQSHYLSYHVGSGITGYADPEKEYDECLIKAKAIQKVLSGK